MRPLTKEAEAKLIGAIEKAAAYVNGGLNPNDAIVKSASESNIPSGHINLMVHAYNTGRTTKQREQGNDTLEKAADFPLADADTVMDALYPKAVKTSAEIVRNHVVSAEYALPVRDMLARRQAATTKAAAAKISLPEKTWTPPPRDEEAAVRKAASQKRAAELAQEELRRQATVAYAKAAAAMEELHDYFRRPGNLSFQDAVRETELRLGADGVTVLKKLAAVYPRLEKQAATKEMHFGDLQAVNLVSNVLDAVTAYNKAQARVPAAKQAAAKKETPVIITGSILHNPAAEPLVLKSAMPRVLDGGTGAGDYWHMTDPGAPPGGNYLREVDPDDYDPAVIGSPPDADHALFSIPGGPAVWLHRNHAAPPAPTWTPPPGGGGRGGSGGGGGGGGSGGGAGGGGGGPGGAGGGGAGGGGRGGRRGGGGGGGGGGGNDEERPRGLDYDGNVLPGAADILGTAKSIAGAMGQSAADKARKMKEKAYRGLTDPEHETSLRNIRAQGVLHDLILNDPVISGHDPHEVAMAFNELADVSPNFVDSPATMTALLRKRLEAGHLADFDIKQLIDMEKAKADTGKARMETQKIERELI